MSDDFSAEGLALFVPSVCRRRKIARKRVEVVITFGIEGMGTEAFPLNQEVAHGSAIGSDELSCILCC